MVGEHSVTSRIDQMTGALFISCHVQPPVLNAMEYPELKRWHDWLKLSNDYEEKQAAETRKKLGLKP